MKKNVAGLCGFYFHFPVLTYTEKNRPIPAMKQSDTETIFRRCRLHLLIRCLFGYSQFSPSSVSSCADLVIRPEASFLEPDAGKRDRRNLPAVFISMSMEHRQCPEVSFRRARRAATVCLLLARTNPLRQKTGIEAHKRANRFVRAGYNPRCHPCASPVSLPGPSAVSRTFRTHPFRRAAWC